MFGDKNIKVQKSKGKKREKIMASCLGVYLSDDILKYAKLSMDNNKNVKLEEYGVRYVKTGKKEALKSIIEETNSQNIPVALNPQGDEFINIQLYDQAQSKAYIADVVKMEFEAWCEKRAKTLERYNYVYKISELKTSDNKHNGVIDVLEKSVVEEFSSLAGAKVTHMSPPELLIDKLVPLDEINYILVNLDDELSIETVINGRLADFKTYPTGMKKILTQAAGKLGSFQKTYEACKQLNVFSEGDTSTNNKELEIIVEPILQDILKEIQAVVNRNRKEVTKVFLAGDGIVFTNIDILFREFLDMKTEILKPHFIMDTSNVKNMAEVLETTQAVALAYEVLQPTNKTLEFMNANTKIKSTFTGIFSKKPKQPKVKKTASEKSQENLGAKIVFDPNKTKVGLICASIAVGLCLVAYVIFSSMYVSKVNSMVKEINAKTDKAKKTVATVNSDADYIQKNATEYKDINEQVQEVVDQIEGNQIGKFSTYNVASFLQGIIKVIPKNVQLKTISSDDNKNIKITAQSSNYADLGYFVAELKLSGTLNDVKINKITSGDITVIEIGGELP